MEFDSLNDKAKEAWAQSRIDQGNYLLRTIALGLMLMPVSFMLKYGFDGKKCVPSITEVLNGFSNTTFISMLLLIAILGIWALYLTSSGIYMLNKIPEKTSERRFKRSFKRKF